MNKFLSSNELRYNASLVKEGFDSLLELRFANYNTNNCAFIRVHICPNGFVVILSGINFINLNPLRFFNNYTKTSCSLIKVFIQDFSLFLLTCTIYNGPLVLEELDWFVVLEFPSLIVFPSLMLVYRINYLWMEELSSIYTREIIVNIELPFVQ
jgi:hypothetical protein